MKTFRQLLIKERKDRKGKTIPAGLDQWVADMKVARKAGNKELANSIQKNIEKEARKKGLDLKDVMGESFDKVGKYFTEEVIASLDEMVSHIKNTRSVSFKDGNTFEYSYENDDGEDVPWFAVLTVEENAPVITFGAGTKDAVKYMTETTEELDGKLNHHDVPRKG